MRDEGREVRADESVANVKSQANFSSLSPFPLFQSVTAPDVGAALGNLLKDRRSGTRRSAAEAIGKVRRGDPLVIPALHPASKDSDDQVRQAVTGALMRLKR